MKTKQELKEEIERLQAEYDAMTDDCDFAPKDGADYYYVDACGLTDGTCYTGHCVDIDRNHYFNIYPTQLMAEKAAKLMRRSNAIIRACLLVDPDFEPDWEDEDQEKWSFEKKYSSYLSRCDCALRVAPAYASTRNKLLQAKELIEKWGVK